MLTIPHLYLAPIQGVTTPIFRSLYHQHFSGVDACFSPFVKIHKIRHTHKKKKDEFSPYAASSPLVPQILSNDADEFLIFDQELHALGYPEFNWNLGCPVKMVTQKKRGSGLLPHADKIQAILEQIIPKLHCQLSLKVRLGLNHPDELFTLIPSFNNFPIKELIIHPRLGTQLYDGQVDLQAFGECLRLSKHAVIFNGDIFNVQTYHALQKQFPQIHGWMLGRGVLANPFLPAQIKGLTENTSDKLGRIQQFHANYALQYERVLSGPVHIVDKLKEFWFYLHFLFEEGKPFLHHLIKVKRYDAYQILVNEFFDSRPKMLEHIQVASEEFR